MNREAPLVTTRLLINTWKFGPRSITILFKIKKKIKNFRVHLCKNYANTCPILEVPMAKKIDNNFEDYRSQYIKFLNTTNNDSKIRSKNSIA